MNTVKKLNQKEVKQLAQILECYISSKTCIALSSLLSESISHTIKIEADGISTIQEIKHPRDEIKICAVRLSGRGDTHIEICYIISLEHAKKLASKLLCQDVTEIDEMGFSAIQETTNILTGSFFNALADGTGYRLDISTPNFVKGERISLIRLTAQDVTDLIDSVVIADVELIGKKTGIKINMIIMQDIENTRKLLSNNLKKKPKDLDKNLEISSEENPNSELDPLSEKTRSSTQYNIGSENSEIEAILEDFLKEN